MAINPNNTSFSQMSCFFISCYDVWALIVTAALYNFRHKCSYDLPGATLPCFWSYIYLFIFIKYPFDHEIKKSTVLFDWLAKTKPCKPS